MFQSWSPQIIPNIGWILVDHEVIAEEFLGEPKMGTKTFWGQRDLAKTYSFIQHFGDSLGLGHVKS